MCVWDVLRLLDPPYIMNPVYFLTKWPHPPVYLHSPVFWYNRNFLQAWSLLQAPIIIEIVDDPKSAKSAKFISRISYCFYILYT